MNCTTHMEREAVGQCSGCGAALCEECAIRREGGSLICTRCVALQAAQDVVTGTKDRQEKVEIGRKDREKKKRRKGLFWVGLQVGILAICLGIIAFRMPSITRILKNDKPIRLGTFKTDAMTDECIRVLWQVAKELQEGRMPGDDLICPASRKPFIIEKTEDDIVARCPQPELYGFKNIGVSKNHPIPELIR